MWCKEFLVLIIIFDINCNSASKCDEKAKKLLEPCTCDNSGLLRCVGPDVTDATFARIQPFLPTIYMRDSISFFLAKTNVTSLNTSVFNPVLFDLSFNYNYNFKNLIVYENGYLNQIDFSTLKSSRKSLTRLEVFSNGANMNTSLIEEKGFFNDFENLKFLKLSNINLTSADSVFNRVDYVYGRSTLKALNLGVLDLSGNNLTEIDLFRNGLTTVRYKVDLSDNKLISSSFHIDSTNKLTVDNFPYLILKGNNITYLDEGVFGVLGTTSSPKLEMDFDNFICDFRSKWIFEAYYRSNEFGWLQNQTLFECPLNRINLDILKDDDLYDCFEHSDCKFAYWSEE